MGLTEPYERLAETVRRQGARILATLVRTVGDLQLAEDAVQEAVVAALRDWPRSGIPDQPAAWLTVAARRKAIDLLRRESARTRKEALLSAPVDEEEAVVRDDQLRLIFTCCHPAIAPEARVALALRTLCGLSTAQIAAVLLTGEAAMAKRLTRTRQKITAARIPYRVPDEADLPARLATVCGVVHGLYTAGHAPLGGDRPIAVDLCAEAVRLARLICSLMPDEAMPAAVLALLLLTEARRPARVDPAGDLVLLADQDRRHWQRDLIDEGARLLAGSLRRTAGIADPYQLQAAIALEHDRAAQFAQTDWAEIVRLYDLLAGVAPSPAVGLARAVAVAELAGPEAGLEALEPITPSERWHAVRGELLARLGRYAEAVAATEASMTDGLTPAERRYRRRRIAEWTSLSP